MAHQSQRTIFPVDRIAERPPYLTRKALYTLVTERCAWADLARVAATDRGPFSDHLRHNFWLLRNEPGLKAALKQIVNDNHCEDEMAFFRLLRAGLVKGCGEVCHCRCDLYRMYFKDKLNEHKHKNP